LIFVGSSFSKLLLFICIVKIYGHAPISVNFVKY